MRVQVTLGYAEGKLVMRQTEAAHHIDAAQKALAALLASRGVVAGPFAIEIVPEVSNGESRL